MVKLRWQVDNLELDAHTFENSLKAQQFVRKQLTKMPQCHAKWLPTEVVVFSGPNIHSRFTLEPIR